MTNEPTPAMLESAAQRAEEMAAQAKEEPSGFYFGRTRRYWEYRASGLRDKAAELRKRGLIIETGVS